MEILILGGTGFIGSYLIPFLIQKHHTIYAVVRPHKKVSFPKDVNIIQGDPTQRGEWQKCISQVDVIINLTGAHIARVWSKKVKKEILSTRVESTKNIVENISSTQLLINMSAIGYYGFAKDQWCTEETPPGNDFLAFVCKAWEQEAWKAQTKGSQLAILRLGVVLGRGGVLEQMVQMYTKFLGSQLGSGKQWFSWIHIRDLLSVFEWIVENQKSQGVYNVCTPSPIQNKELTKTLAKLLNVRTTLTVPAIVLKTMIGEAANLILEGQRVYPKRLLEEGFHFQFPKIEQALEDLVATPKKVLG